MLLIRTTPSRKPGMGKIKGTTILCVIKSAFCTSDQDLMCSLQLLLAWLLNEAWFSNLVLTIKCVKIHLITKWSAAFPILYNYACHIKLTRLLGTATLAPVNCFFMTSKQEKYLFITKMRCFRNGMTQAYTVH